MLFIKLSLAFLAFATSAGTILNFEHQWSSDFIYRPESAFNATRDVFYLLYTKNNPSGENISVGSVSSNFNPVYPTRIFIHGWENDHNSPIPTEIKKAYLANSVNFNLVSVFQNILRNVAFSGFLQILVDWSALALNIDYDIVRKGCGSVADELAKLLRFLVDQNLTSLGTLVMSGHSLGKNAGRYDKSVKLCKFPCKVRTLLDSLENKFQTFMQLSAWTPLDPDTRSLILHQDLAPLMRTKIWSFQYNCSYSLHLQNDCSSGPHNINFWSLVHHRDQRLFHE